MLFDVQLDTDNNPATGNSPTGYESTFGWDYAVGGVDPRGSITASIVRVLGPNSGQVIPAGRSTVAFTAGNQARVVVPLSVLGNDDGRLTLRIVRETGR